MINIKKKNGIDIMNKRNKKHKLNEFRKKLKEIEREQTDRITKEESKLLLHVLIYKFDGFASQQQIINAYMSSKYHWGNKRTSVALKTLAEIGVIDRTRSESDNWTLFFLVKGFLKECKERIVQAGLAIRKRMVSYFSAVLTINRPGKTRAAT